MKIDENGKVEVSEYPYVEKSYQRYLSRGFQFENGRIGFIETQDVPIILGGSISFDRGYKQVIVSEGVLYVKRFKTNDPVSYIFQTKEVFKTTIYHEYKPLNQEEVEKILNMTYDYDMVKRFMALAKYIYEVKGKHQFDYRGDWKGYENDNES